MQIVITSSLSFSFTQCMLSFFKQIFFLSMPNPSRGPNLTKQTFQVSPSRLCCVSTRTPSRAPPIRTRTSPTAAFAWTSCSSPARPSLDRETSPASFSGWRQAGAGRNSSSRQRRQPKDPLTLLTPSGRRPRHRWQLPGCCLSGSWPGYERASPFLA